MPDIDILVPYATKNYVLNPSFEIDDTGWVADGSTTSVVMTRARFERKGLQVVTQGNVKNEGVYYPITNALFKGNVSGSVYIRGVGKLRIRLYDAVTGQDSASIGVDIHDKYWQRLEVLGYSSGGGDLRLRVETDDVSQAVTFYIDGAQAEPGEYVSSYCDGAQPGCRWNGVKNGSISERKISSSEGGRWVSVREPDCSPSTYITTFSGLGLPPITINRQRMALAPGSFFDSIREEERVIQFAVNVKDDEAQDRTGNGKLILNKIRQNLIDIVKPDMNPDNEPFWLRYRDGDKSVMTKVMYESGLEYDGDFRNKWKNSIPLRFLATDPFWYEDDQEVHILDTETTELQDNIVISRMNGQWQFLGNGLELVAGTQYVVAFAEDSNGRIYAGGSFIQDGSASSVRRIAYLSDNLTTWVEPATGLNDVVSDILAHPNGKIYICGNFTADNDGNTYNRIVEYDPVTDSFAALGTGLNGNALAMDIDENGDLYVSGVFTTAGGIAVYRFARWDGSSWHTVSNMFTDIGQTVLPYDVIVESSSSIYVCGLGGSSAIFINYDGTSWSSAGTIANSGTDNYPWTMKQDIDGSIILGLNNTNPFDTNPAPAVVRWNGSSFEDLGFPYSYYSQYRPDIFQIAIDRDRNVYVIGRIPSPSKIPGEQILIGFYNKSSWAFLDVDVDLDISTAQGIFVTSQNDFIMGLTSDAGATVNMQSSGFTDIEIRSTAFTFPIISFSGNGRIVWLENQETGQIVYLNYTLNDNEILELDYRIGIKSIISNYGGSKPDAVLPQSDDIVLMPKKQFQTVLNKIACYITDEVAPVVQLRYIPTHWSVDAISEQ